MHNQVRYKQLHRVLACSTWKCCPPPWTRCHNPHYHGLRGLRSYLRFIRDEPFKSSGPTERLRFRPSGLKLPYCKVRLSTLFTSPPRCSVAGSNGNMPGPHVGRRCETGTEWDDVAKLCQACHALQYTRAGHILIPFMPSSYTYLTPT